MCYLQCSNMCLQTTRNPPHPHKTSFVFNLNKNRKQDIVVEQEGRPTSWRDLLIHRLFFFVFFCDCAVKTLKHHHKAAQNKLAKVPLRLEAWSHAARCQFLQPPRLPMEDRASRIRLRLFAWKGSQLHLYVKTQ